MGQLAVKGLVYIALTALSLVYLFPYLWMISTSLKDESVMFQDPQTLIPRVWNFTHYANALSYIPFMQFVKNTLVYCVLSSIGAVLSSMIVAYGFSKVNWKWRDQVFIFVLATMMLPGKVKMIPLFLVFNALKLVGTNVPLILPNFFAPAFYVFLLRQYFRTIPGELSESARIDGCNDLMILFRIITPLSTAALATVGLFQFLDAWTDFQGPMIYLSDQNKYTISLGLQFFLQAHGTKWGMLLAASMMVTLPIIVLFFFTQKTFIQGIATAGIKG